MDPTSDVPAASSSIRQICTNLRDQLRQIATDKKGLTNPKPGPPLAPRSLNQGDDTQQHDTELNLQRRYIQTAMLMVDLKAANRDVFFGIEKVKEQVLAAKATSDAHHLNLQNLLYEKAFLLQEIRRCKEFTTDETNRIDLLPEDQFVATAPANLAEVSKDENAHKFHLNRLSHELLLRKELKAQLERKKLQKKSVLSTTAQKNKFLDGIPTQLKHIEQATLPLQKYLKLQSSKQRDLHEQCRQLPTPLYILYCQLETFGSSFGNVTVQVAESVHVVTEVAKGDPKKRKRESSLDPTLAKKRPERSPSPVNDDSRKARDNDSQPTADVDDASSQESDDHDVYAPSKLAVTARLRSTGEDGQKVDLFVRFQYLPKLDIVTVEPDNAPSGLLANLFPNDTGQLFPRATVEVPKSRRFNEEIKGRPYKWAQWLAGLYNLCPVETLENGQYASNVVPKPTEAPTKDIVHRILNRVAAQQSLSEQLSALSKCPHPVPVYDQAKALFPQNAVSKLVLWEEIEYDEAEALMAKVQPNKSAMPVIQIEPYDANKSAVSRGGTAQDDSQDGSSQAGDADTDVWKTFGCRCFRGKMQVGNGDNVSMVVQVFVDYPRRAPRFSLSRVSDAGVDNNLKSLEIELNAFANELMFEDGPTGMAASMFLLSHQLRRLQMCLDVLGGDVEATRMFGRPRRGRDRRLAFVFNPETKQFVHR